MNMDMMSRKLSLSGDDLFSSNANTSINKSKKEHSIRSILNGSSLDQVIQNTQNGKGIFD